jgi:hypothetical protein
MAKQYVLLHDRLGGSTLSRADGYQSLRQAENCELCIDALESFQGAQGTMDIGNSQFRKGCRRAALKSDLPQFRCRLEGENLTYSIP